MANIDANNYYLNDHHIDQLAFQLLIHRPNFPQMDEAQATKELATILKNLYSERNKYHKPLI